MDATQTKRLHYIDWVRILAFGLLFIFHAVRFFDSYPWHIKNDETSVLIDHFVEFTHSWRMQIVFLVSGVGTYFSLRSEKSGFVSTRIARLVIPFIFSVVVLVPPQKYLESIHHEGYDGSMMTFLATYLDDQVSEQGGFSPTWLGHFGYHVWYLAYLFIQTMLLLPVMIIIIRNDRIRTGIEKLTSQIAGLFAMLLPVVLLDFSLRPIFPAYLDWADFAVYGMFFLYGFVLQLNNKAILVIEKHVILFFLIGMSCWATYLFNRDHFDRMSVPQYGADYFFMIVLKNINSLCWVLAFLALAKKYLNFRFKLLNDLNQGVLPFYVLHQTVIVIIGFFVIRLSWSIPGKLAIIMSASLISSLVLYQLIRRNSAARFLFGMKVIRDQGK